MISNNTLNELFAGMNMIPLSETVKEISENIINKWHALEHELSSFDDSLILTEFRDSSSIEHHIELLSLINTYQWHEEDRARDVQASDADIAAVKRSIDKLNAMRVNKTEEIDNLMFGHFTFNNDAPLNTETPGSVIDRLTILALKKYHMEYEANREDSSEQLRLKCAEKLSTIRKQMNDLSEAYTSLIDEIRAGRRRYALYRQFKMYNDPELNPVLYKKK
jgi:chromosome segregation ATPase